MTEYFKALTLEEVIKERLRRSASIGFNSELRDKYDKDKNILEKVTVEDIRKFGMIPEFIGRLPVVFTLQGLTRDMMVKVTDPALLEATGGIVQGMSGSPILQDGRLVGAVTHVLVGDSTQGYGILAQRMMETGEA